MSHVHKNLYEKYGGAPTVEKLVHYFYEQLVLKDPLVIHFFQHTNMELQKKRMINFFTFALGGSDKYTGKTMKQSHQGMHIKEADYNRVIQHLTTTLSVHGVEAEDIQAIGAKLNSYHDDIVEAQ